jgi:hypothetical protein
MTMMSTVCAHPRLTGTALWALLLLVVSLPIGMGLRALGQLDATYAFSTSRLAAAQKTLESAQDSIQGVQAPEWLLMDGLDTTEDTIRRDIMAAFSGAGLSLTQVNMAPSVEVAQDVYVIELAIDATGSYAQWLGALDGLSTVQGLFLSRLTIQARGLERFDDRLDIEAGFAVYTVDEARRGE